jgi:hypothetical protein
MRSMLTRVPMQTGYGAVIFIEVSLPFIEALVADGDLGGKYYMKPKEIEDATERRRYRHRGPTLRSLVRLALACDSAEEMGERLRQRFERKAARSAPSEAELDRLLVPTAR